MVKSAQEVPILFFRVHFALGRRIVELQLLHRVPNRGDLLLEKHFEVFPLVTLRFAFFDTCFDAGVFYIKKEEKMSDGSLAVFEVREMNDFIPDKVLHFLLNTFRYFSTSSGVLSWISPASVSASASLHPYLRTTKKEKKKENSKHTSHTSPCPG